METSLFRILYGEPKKGELARLRMVRREEVIVSRRFVFFAVTALAFNLRNGEGELARYATPTLLASSRYGSAGLQFGPPSNTLATHRQNPAKPLAPGAAYAPGGRKRVGDTA